MGTTDPDILILRGDAHGIPISKYLTELRERLPDYQIAHAKTLHEEKELISDVRIITGGTLTEEHLDAANNAKLYMAGGAGLSQDLIAMCEQHDVVVTNAPVHGSNIAEYVLGSMLQFSRRLHEGWKRKERSEWRHYQAHDFKGSTVTVVGLGTIGQEIVQRLAAFEVETIGVRYSPEKGGPTDEVVGFEDDSIHDALARTDYLAITCPLTDTTRNLIAEEEFSVLPPDAILVNTARGEIVDTEALVASIQRNRIGGAVLDVTDPEPLPTDHELWNFENVLITPHMSGHTPAYWSRCADLLSDNIDRIEEHGDYTNLKNVVELNSSGELIYR